MNDTVQSRTLSLSRLLGGAGGDLPKERYQDTRKWQTKRGIWKMRPWVDRIRDGKVVRVKETITIGKMGAREAEAKRKEILATLNRADYIITSQINFGAFVEEYRQLHVKRLSTSTQAKYENHLRVHIRPAFEKLMMCEVTTLLAQQWLDSREVSWATRTDIRNILSSIFTCAMKWGRWKDTNPIRFVNAGRVQAVREKRKLTDEQTRLLLAELPEQVRLIVEVALFCTLRISEILGLQWKHLDFERGLILVRQRFCRGDLDIPKNQKSIRDVEMGLLAFRLGMLPRGAADEFVFNVKTARGICRDDRDLNQHFLRKAAKKLGIYYQGFGFHAFRREAITSIAAEAGINQAMIAAGHSSMDTSLLYTLRNREEIRKAVEKHQERILGKPEGGVQ